MSENSMRDFLIAKLKCVKCGTTLKLSYEQVPISKSDYRIDRDKEPTGAFMRGLEIAVEPCQTCLKPLEDAVKAMKVLKDLSKIAGKS